MKHAGTLEEWKWVDVYHMIVVILYLFLRHEDVPKALQLISKGFSADATTDELIIHL